MIQLQAYESEHSYFRFFLMEDECYDQSTDSYVPHKAVHFLEENPVVHLDELKQIVKLLEEYTP
jgi:hypothetical protein